MCIRDRFLVSEEKAGLSVEIAKREKQLLEQLDYKNGYSLYVGIPFCPSTVSYTHLDVYKRQDHNGGD